MLPFRLRTKVNDSRLRYGEIAGLAQPRREQCFRTMSGGIPEN